MARTNPIAARTRCSDPRAIRPRECHELGITPHAVRHTLHIVYNSVGIQPRAGRRDLGRALVAGIISVLDLPAEKHPIYAA